MSKKVFYHNPIFSRVRKPKYRYIPVQETLTNDELGTYVTFGLSICTVEEEISFVSDITTDYEEIKRLADLCTTKELDPIHLKDVLEDFITDSEAELALT